MDGGSSSKGVDVENLYGNISLEDEEEGGITLDEAEQGALGDTYQFSLVGRFLTDKSVNGLAMKNVLAALWRPVKGVCVKEIGSNRFIFQFFHELDVSRVERTGPWTFDNNPLLLKRLCIGDQPTQVPLNSLALWVQIYDVPVGFTTERVGVLIGNYIGTFLEADPKNSSGFWKSYMRIRISIDVRVALKRRMKLKKNGGEWVWLNFKYERLPSFCFFCGLLGHSERFCGKLYDCVDIPVERAYGAWLRASSRRNGTQVGERWLRSESDATDLGGDSYSKETSASENVAVDKDKVVVNPVHGTCIEGREVSPYIVGMAQAREYRLSKHTYMKFRFYNMKAPRP